VQSATMHLFTPRAAYRMRYSPMGGRPDQPEHPPVGAQIDYYLASEPSGDLKLEILDAKGGIIRSITSGAPPAGPAGVAPADTEQSTQEMRAMPAQFAQQRLSKRSGSNRYRWDLRYGSATGPMAVPGNYRVRLSTEGWTRTEPLEIRIDPRLEKDGVTPADLEEQLA